MEDTPVNAAHAYANAAEELEEKEQWGKAMQAHFRAAEQFALAINYTSDPEAIRTLKLLYTNHTRQGKEVQRRLAKQSQQSPKPQEQSNPSSSHRTRKPSSSTSSKSNSNNPQVKHNSEQRIQQNQSRQGSTLSTQPTAHSSSRQTTSSSDHKLSSDYLRAGNSATLEFASASTSSKQNPVLSDSVTSMGVSRTSIMTSSITPSVMDGSSGSEKTVEESYMILKGTNESESTDEESADPFNKFWDIVEGLVQKISNPVAFATAPLHGADSRATFYSNTIQPSLPFRHNNTVDKNIVDDSKVEELNAAMMESFCIIPKDQRPGSRTGAPPQSSLASSSSTPRIPPDGKKSTKTLEELSIENERLKAVIDNFSKQMVNYEKTAEENNMLKSSILQFKNDVQKQAKRIKNQETSRSSSMVKQTSPESSTVGNSHLQKRIKELEEENRILKSEKEKQQTLATKYKAEKDKQQELAEKYKDYKDKYEAIREAAKKKRGNKQVEASQSLSKPSNSTIIPDQKTIHNQSTSSLTSPAITTGSITVPTSDADNTNLSDLII